MNVRLRELAARQDDLVAAWQLLTLGWNRAMIDHRVHQSGWQVVHPGVYALFSAAPTRRQRWVAATLTAPGCFLSHASAGACFGFRRFDASFEIVTRPGSGGRKRLGRVLVCRSKTLAGDTTRHEGIPITTAARTLIDICAGLDAKAAGRAFREALRLKTTTMEQLAATLARHRGRRGTRVLTQLVRRYATIPYQRTRSDAEALGLELLHDAGFEPPRVNFTIAGEEADLCWPARRLIVEIDGPQFHRFPDEDACKQRAWEADGYVVRRLPSDAVYHRPDALLGILAAQ